MKLGIIADDLTGAMDAGVQLSNCGRQVAVSVSDLSEPLALLEVADTIVWDTESRNISPDLAGKKVEASVLELQKANCRFYYKKIDSTLRGNIGAEIETILKVSGKKAVLLAAALPASGRTTYNGIHLVNKTPLALTDIASDPFSPVISSFVPDILRRQTDLPCTLIPRKSVSAGPDKLAQNLLDAVAAGNRILAVDAVNNRDLNNIAEACMRCLEILPCGSAGLLESLAYLQGTSMERLEGGQPYTKSAPALILSGSPAAMSKLQLQHAVIHDRELVLVSASNSAIEGDEAVLQTEIDEIADILLFILKSGRHAALDAAGEGKAEIAAKFGGDSKRLEKASSRVQQLITGVLSKVTGGIMPGMLIVFGGDTAASILRDTGAKGLAISSEVEKYIPEGRLIGGKLDGMSIVTKAGGFGVHDTLINIIRNFYKY